ncbi:MAG: tRNA lysidine(34) synthetase TilS [Clostridia bacterium]|nr:tRNA lysidine(34) synthetase TilS [Clostridia bacterium]
MLKYLPDGVFTSPISLLQTFPDSLSVSGIDRDFKPSSILLAYSGGADSSLLLALLDVFCRENEIKLYAAHVNHGIRGDEAIRDREHCKEVCTRRGIQLFVLNTDVPRIAAERGESIESAAREVRYEFFSKLMAEHDIPVLATAHNGDDNAETVIFRLARGSGALGLCGIPSVRTLENGGLVIRPILSAPKEKILDICTQNGIEYVYDSTNSDINYTRNSIRAVILPAIRQINPCFCTSVLRTAELLREDEEFISDLADEYLKDPDYDLTKKLSSLKRPVFMRVMRKLCISNGTLMPEYTHLNELRRLTERSSDGSSVSLPGKIKAQIRSGRLVFLPDTREKKEKKSLPISYINIGENPLPFGYELALYEENSTDPSQSTPQIQRREVNIYKLFTHTSLKSDKISGRLFVRSRQSGDRIDLGGFSKDIRDLFSEKKLPIEERNTFPILFDDKGAVWVPGIALRHGLETDDKNYPKKMKLTLRQTFERTYGSDK